MTRLENLHSDCANLIAALRQPVHDASAEDLADEINERIATIRVQYEFLRTTDDGVNAARTLARTFAAVSAYSTLVLAPLRRPGTLN